MHNLTRSIFFREDDVGLPKSKVVTARASEISKETNFQTKNGNFWTELTFKEILKFDAIICAVDNFEARIRLNSLAQLTNKLLINTGIDHRFASVEIFPFNFSDDVLAMNVQFHIPFMRKYRLGIRAVGLKDLSRKQCYSHNLNNSEHCSSNCRFSII